MFGYVTLYRKGLADAEMDRYQAYYCGCAGAGPPLRTHRTVGIKL